MMRYRGLVMLVEDDEDLRLATADTLRLLGFEPQCFARAEPALEALTPEYQGVILSDLKMPGLSGQEFLEAAKARAPDVPFVMITGQGDIPAALSAVRAGAYDFLEKPCAPELMIEVVRRASELRRLGLENAALKAKLGAAVDPLARIVGASEAAQRLRQQLSGLARLNVDLLIAGETGVGKDLAAQVLNALSARSEASFIAINCAALSEQEIDREVFGSAEKIGLIARADGGTLYLDQLEAMPLELQARLLRVIEASEITPLGSAPQRVDLRIFASVKGEPERLVSEGRLRADLFHRFNAGALRLPPLRERKGDALQLVEHFLAEAAARHGLQRPQLSSEQKRQIGYHAWPGNVREARNFAERLVIGMEPEIGGFERSGGEVGSSITLEQGYEAALEAFESDLLRSALLATGGRKEKAAELLGIPRKRLYLRLKQYGIG